MCKGENISKNISEKGSHWRHQRYNKDDNTFETAVGYKMNWHNNEPKVLHSFSRGHIDFKPTWRMKLRMIVGVLLM